jgi:hypothetical protein
VVAGGGILGTGFGGEGVDLPSWHLLLPNGPEARVLYVGSPTGDTAAGLAVSFKAVLVAEPTPELATTTRPRVGALTDRTLRVMSSGGDLAVRPASVDLAVIEIAEQLPGRRGDWALLGQTVDVRPVLRAIHVALKPEGFVYLGMTRSGGPRRRRISSFLSIYRVRRLLTKAGYGEVRVWCAYPDCRDPKFLVECAGPVFQWFLRLFAGRRRRGLRRVAQRVFNAAHLLEYTAPGYAVLARRQGARAE